MPSMEIQVLETVFSATEKAEMIRCVADAVGGGRIAGSMPRGATMIMVAIAS
ncbi:hypothetical protein SAMN05216236_102185 [Sedimentitalea nanhaiensis]|uniref:4-oxalocrotonate tautomerase n=1 Tax=Sedimentitalea nanhaiensis TaxID=999627 RepID=A0A1I6YFM0_9RHOB|nr:hypothetical protein SAMN05216236_102185 [Sedimentitalea nanhaiensis]